MDGQTVYKPDSRSNLSYLNRQPSLDNCIPQQRRKCKGQLVSVVIYIHVQTAMHIIMQSV